MAHFPSEAHSIAAVQLKHPCRYIILAGKDYLFPSIPALTHHTVPQYTLEQRHDNFKHLMTAEKSKIDRS